MTIPERANSELPPICLEREKHHHHDPPDVFSFPIILFGVVPLTSFKGSGPRVYYGRLVRGSLRQLMPMIIGTYLQRAKG